MQPTFANRVGAVLLRCARQKFNSYVEDIMLSERAVIVEVNQSMKALRYPIAAAKLRKHTNDIM